MARSLCVKQGRIMAGTFSGYFTIVTQIAHGPWSCRDKTEEADDEALPSRARCSAQRCAADTGPRDEKAPFLAGSEMAPLSGDGPVSAQRHYAPQRARDDPVDRYSEAPAIPRRPIPCAPPAWTGGAWLG